MRIATKSRNYADGIEAVKRVITGDSMTRQDMAEACNINVIYAKTQRGEIVLANQVMPEYGDYSNVQSYDQMLEMINEAEDAFLSLPAEERRKYNDDPAEYYRLNMEEASKRLQKQLDEEKAVLDKAAYDKSVEEAKALLGKSQDTEN